MEIRGSFAINIVTKNYKTLPVCETAFHKNTTALKDVVLCPKNIIDETKLLYFLCFYFIFL
jgi:hypothetical protein